MDQLTDTLIAGFSVFFIFSAITLLTCAYFVYSTRRAARAFPPEIYDIKWAKSFWIYLSFILATLAFGQLYLLQYFGQGFAIKPNLLVVVWLRWIYVGLIGGIFIGLLNYVMIKKPHGAQSFFSVLFYLLSIGSLYGASLSQSDALRIIWIVSSLICFVIAIFLICWPESRLWGEDYEAVKQIIFSQESVWCVMTKSLPREHRESSIKVWAFIYRLILLWQIILTYIGYLINWFLSDSNEFTDIAPLDTSLLVYLILDFFFILPFLVLLISLTFLNVTKKVTAKNKRTGHKHFASPHPHEL
jgi:hypothetical protein